MAIPEDERKAILDEAFPEQIESYTRPETVESDFPFSDEFPPFIAKDKVLFSLTNLIIRQMLSNDKILKETLDSISTKIASADIQMATQLVKGLMSAADKKKLDEIEAKANNYVHPPSGVVAGTYKSVAVNAQGHITAGTNPTTLAGYGIVDAASKVHGNHVPTIEKTVSNKRFLRNDNTWQDVSPGNIGAYTKAETDALISHSSLHFEYENEVVADGTITLTFTKSMRSVCGFYQSVVFSKGASYTLTKMPILADGYILITQPTPGTSSGDDWIYSQHMFAVLVWNDKQYYVPKNCYIPVKEGMILAETDADTVYHYAADEAGYNVVKAAYDAKTNAASTDTNTGTDTSGGSSSSTDNDRNPGGGGAGH